MPWHIGVWGKKKIGDSDSAHEQGTHYGARTQVHHGNVYYGYLFNSWLLTLACQKQLHGWLVLRATRAAAELGTRGAQSTQSTAPLGRRECIGSQRLVASASTASAVFLSSHLLALLKSRHSYSTLADSTRLAPKSRHAQFSDHDP